VSASLTDGFEPLTMIRQWRKSWSDFLTVFATLCEVSFSNEQSLYDEICPKPRCANRKLSSNSGRRLKCENCQEAIEQPQPRFAFGYQAADSTGSVQIVELSNNSIGKRLLAFTAQELTDETQKGHKA
jgi:hypothetical protein